MTLKQLRDWHREVEALLAKAGSMSAGASRHKAAADAIDAHITKVREVIASIDLRAETYLDPQCKGWADKLTAAL